MLDRRGWRWEPGEPMRFTPMEDPFLIPKGNSLKQSVCCLGERRAVKE